MAKNVIPGCHFDSTDSNSSSNNYSKYFSVWVLPICPSIKRLIILKTRLKEVFYPILQNRKLRVHN